MGKSKTVVVSAADIQAQWAQEANNPRQLPSETIIKQQRAIGELAHENNSIKKQLEKALDKLDKSKGGSASLREHLDSILAKHGIKAAFEPLIAMAMEQWPKDEHTPQVLWGQFKLEADQRIKIWCEILSYQLPKLKAMEVSGQVDNSLTVYVKRFGGNPQSNGPTVEEVQQVAIKQILPDGPTIDLPKVTKRSFTAPKETDEH